MIDEVDENEEDNSEDEDSETEKGGRRSPPLAQPESLANNPQSINESWNTYRENREEK